MQLCYSELFQGNAYFDKHSNAIFTSMTQLENYDFVNSQFSLVTPTIEHEKIHAFNSSKVRKKCPSEILNSTFFIEHGLDNYDGMLPINYKDGFQTDEIEATFKEVVINWNNFKNRSKEFQERINSLGNIYNNIKLLKTFSLNIQSILSKPIVVSAVLYEHEGLYLNAFQNNEKNAILFYSTNKEQIDFLNSFTYGKKLKINEEIIGLNNESRVIQEKIKIAFFTKLNNLCKRIDSLREEIIPLTESLSIEVGQDEYNEKTSRVDNELGAFEKILKEMHNQESCLEKN